MTSEYCEFICIQAKDANEVIQTLNDHKVFSYIFPHATEPRKQPHQSWYLVTLLPDPGQFDDVYDLIPEMVLKQSKRHGCNADDAIFSYTHQKFDYSPWYSLNAGAKPKFHQPKELVDMFEKILFVYHDYTDWDIHAFRMGKSVLQLSKKANYDGASKKEMAVYFGVPIENVITALQGDFNTLCRQFHIPFWIDFLHHGGELEQPEIYHRYGYCLDMNNPSLILPNHD